MRTLLYLLFLVCLALLLFFVGSVRRTKSLLRKIRFSKENVLVKDEVNLLLLPGMIGGRAARSQINQSADRERIRK